MEFKVEDNQPTMELPSGEKLKVLERVPEPKYQGASGASGASVTFGGSEFYFLNVNYPPHVLFVYDGRDGIGKSHLAAWRCVEGNWKNGGL